MDLPHMNVVRWSKNRKLAIIKNIREGSITTDQVAKIYGIDAEELGFWAKMYDTFGERGLLAGQIQKNSRRLQGAV